MYKYLDNIQKVEDLKKLKLSELEGLAQDIRDSLVDNVAKTGGHLASNLGVVELTLALHYVFNSPKDKIVFDVGHQCYVHKMLTGRKDQMHTIRQYGGLSGFPKRNESIHDVFETGHSSTSISAALGLANARDINKEDHNVVAIIGDGALTGGMALEALNDAGRKRSNLIVILNDNEMSISKNVGSISTLLSKLRTGRKYYSAKKEIEGVLAKVPGIGHPLVKIIRKIKGAVKKMFVNGGMLFEELGFRYIGPVNGHDLDELIHLLRRVKNVKQPILLHVHTKKGKGYYPAEIRPDLFHGVGKFNKDTGEVNSTEGSSYSSEFGKALCEIGSQNSKVVAITAAMKSGTGLDTFASQYPDRFFDVGIAEQHGMTLAAGMASSGLRPVFALYSTFLQRAYDQLLHDVALQNLPVVVALDRSGLVGRDGETHQGVFDLSFLIALPNIQILTPTSYDDLKQMLNWSINTHCGPVIIRYPRGGEAINYPPMTDPLLKPIQLTKGQDLAIITYGRLTDEAITAALELEKEGVGVSVITMKRIKPLDMDCINDMIAGNTKVLILEETVHYGGIGSHMLQKINPEHDVKVLSLPDKFIEHGSSEELTAIYGLDSQGIVNFVNNWENKSNAASQKKWAINHS